MDGVIYPELIQQTASLQLRGVLVGDAEIPASKDLVAEALEAIRVLNQVPFESRGRPWRITPVRLWLAQLGVLPFPLPFHDPDETEEQVGYSDQEVRQRQIVGGVRKVDFVGSVVAVEEIGLLQEALQGCDQKTSEKKDVCFLLFWMRRRKKKKAHPTGQQVSDVLMEDDQTTASTAGIHAAHASYGERLKPLGFFFFCPNQRTITIEDTDRARTLLSC